MAHHCHQQWDDGQGGDAYVRRLDAFAFCQLSFSTGRLILEMAHLPTPQSELGRGASRQNPATVKVTLER